MAGQSPLSVLHVFSSFAVGGPQVRFTKLAHFLGDSCRHSIIAMDGEFGCRARLHPDIDVTYPASTSQKGRTVGNIIGFRRQLRSLRPDILVTYNWGAIEWSVANAIPLSHHVHMEDGFGPEERETQIRRRVLTRRAVLRRSTVVVPSRTLERIALDTWRLRPQQVHYIPNGVDCVRFVPRIGRATGAGGAVVIGTVAALRPEKNLTRLIQAFGLVATRLPCELVIAGDGPELPSLRRVTAHLGLGERVHFTGHTDAPERCYGAFDIFSLSSDTEQMPLSVIEAMASGLPIAATNVGDVKHMVAEENRGFVTASDREPLATALLALASQPALRQAVGLANREKACARYDEGEMLRAHARLLRVHRTAAFDDPLASPPAARQSASRHA